MRTPKPTRLRRWLLAVLFLLGLFGLWRAVRPSPLDRAVALRQEMAAAKDLSPDERKAKSAEFRETMRNLSPEERDALFADQRKKMDDEVNRYFALSPREKTKYLDEQINKQEQARKQFEQRKKEGGGPPKGPGGPPRERKQQTPDQIEERKKKMLDRTTPEQRAAMDKFRRFMDDMTNRRQQRGLPTSGGPMGFSFPGSGGGFGPPPGRK